MRALTIIFFCSWKFALTFPMAVYAMRMSFIETLVYANIGGIFGVFFFAFLSQNLINFWDKKVKVRFHRKKNKPVFTRRRRMFITIKQRFGLAGIVILNPIVLSIPISAFLITKYYNRRFSCLLWLIFVQILMSIVYTYFYIYVKGYANSF